MQAYQQRVYEEESELRKKLEGLRKFLTTEVFYSLAMSEQQLLMVQASIMQTYIDILSMRIASF